MAFAFPTPRLRAVIIVAPRECATDQAASSWSARSLRVRGLTCLRIRMFVNSALLRAPCSPPAAAAVALAGEWAGRGREWRVRGCLTLVAGDSGGGAWGLGGYGDGGLEG